jgi:hypothetical protein
MNSKKCEQVMDSFFSLDRDERLPLRDSVHLLFCKECRTKVRYLSKAQKLSAQPLSQRESLSKAGLNAVFDNKTPEWMKNLKPVSMFRWVLSGIIMIVFFVFSGLFLEKTQNDFYMTWFYLILGAAITAYGAAFIGANLDFFVKKIDTAAR